MEVQACIRGFSFMPKKNMELIDLKYVEKDALEQTWKTARRQRLKQQEQRIWDQFVQEQDIVGSIYKDDPYQFLHQLPESCLKELLEEELQKMTHEHTMEKAQEQEAESEAPITDIDNQHVVTVIEEQDKEEMFHIFDDEKDDEVSGPEEEILNDSGGSPPCTVREQHFIRENRSPTKSVSPDKASSKSSENVSNMIESSIYCAKVKELRMKINEELLEIIGTLERLDVTKIEPEEVGRLIKRSGEFCARFNRIYLYQLHRQVQEVRRGAGTAAALPFARHTQFQSQMVRVVSLHQNLLQTIQIFHKSIGQTACVRDSGEALRTLRRTLAEASAACGRTTPPSGLSAAQHLYTDDIEQSCSKLEESLNEYTERLKEYLDNFGNTGKSKQGKYKGKKRTVAAWSKSGTKSGTDTDARLSMYSIDTLRHNLHSKSTISKGHSSGTSKVRGGLSARRKQDENSKEETKSPKRSPKSRRPLMRDPAAGKPRRKVHRELDVPTLVETVAACTSSHISREDTPQQTPRDSNPTTPRRANDTKKELPKKRHTNTPRRKGKSPKKHATHSAQEKRDEPPTDDGKQDDVTTDKKEDINDDKNETSETQKPTLEIKVQLKPKSPEKIIESTLRAARDNFDGVKMQKHDTNVDMKRSRDSPRLKCETGTEMATPANQVLQETVSRSHKEVVSPRCRQDGNIDGRWSDRDKYKVMDVPGSCEVSRLLRQLCGGDATGGKNERVSGTKNAQLLCVNSNTSPRQPSTPQLLRILEETIQKKTPKSVCPKPVMSLLDKEKLRLAFNIPEQTVDNLFQYRTKFVQHMLTSSMYANSAVGKPWEMIGSISDRIIDELLLNCAKEMELRDIVQEIYNSETR